MLAVVLFLLISTLLTMVLAAVNIFLMSLTKLDREKYSVFECGFDLLSSLRLPFSLNFFFITIVFLIFDVELILVLPLIFNFTLVSFKYTSYLIVFFFFFLIVGFLYEWATGLLNWLI
uniref:NADH-ubiquinone oxidoreductase chain 3 n=1 Tax=Aleurocanthus camelliae TaxID=1000661 RepID=A0A1S5RSD1_ALECM|nr:NADH dehydrogenase subunit 3 [Aleurocanthus camelliae]